MKLKKVVLHLIVNGKVNVIIKVPLFVKIMLIKYLVNWQIVIFIIINVKYWNVQTFINLNMILIKNVIKN